jgi:hypothetical protein
MEDLEIMISDDVQLFDNDVVEEHYSDQIFLKDEIYNDVMVAMFLRKFREKFASMSDPKFYIVKRKHDDETGTMICECEFNFEYPHSGFELIRRLNSGSARKRIDNHK